MGESCHLEIRSRGCLNRDRNLLTINGAALVLILMLFQTYMTFFLLWNTKENIAKNVDTFW